MDSEMEEYAGSVISKTNSQYNQLESTDDNSQIVL